MKNKIITLTDHLLIENTKHDYDLTILLHQIENVSKIIASHVKASGLVDILGSTGKTNTFGESVQKLDDLANTLLIDTLLASGYVHAVISEEVAEPIYAPKKTAGDYIVYFDPLDGSSNIDTNCPIGTIFAIYHKKNGLLQQGQKQIAAGYCIYGSSVMFVYTTGHGVNGFTLDPAIGSYLLSHPHMQIPKNGTTYSINEAYEKSFDIALLAYLQSLKKKKNTSLRYVGSMVADVHRTLLKGGIFLHPRNGNRPHGKLRLMLEVNPFAFIAEQAGGKVVGQENKSPLIFKPEHIHDRSPIILGSSTMVDDYLSFFND